MHFVSPAHWHGYMVAGAKMLSHVPTLFVVTLCCPTLQHLFQGWLLLCMCMFVCVPGLCVIVTIQHSIFSTLSTQRNTDPHTPTPTHPPTHTNTRTHTCTLTNALSQSKSHWNSDHALYFGVVTFCCVHGPQLYSRGESAHSL